MIAGLAERMGIQQKLRVLMSSVAEVPAVVGWIRPVILLPAAVVVGLTPRQLESLLAHELAHIRRYDYFVNILQMIVETFLFYHPAVWLVSERIRVERELCCDDLAVGFCGDVLSYARALSQLEQLRPAAPSLAMGSANGPLFQRIQRLLGRGRYEHAPSRLACAAGLLTGFLCLGWFLNARAQQREPLPAMKELTPISKEVPPIPPIPSLLSSPSAVSAQTAPSSPVAPPLAPALAAPALAAPALAAPALAAPALAAPALAAPALAAPALAAPALAAPALAAPALAAPAAPQDITRLPVLSISPAPPASPMAILPLLQDLSFSQQSPWVLFRGNTLIARAGAAEEEQAKRARASVTGDVLWFQLDGKTFITQDKDVIDQIEAAGTETLRRQQIELNGNLLMARLQVAQAARQATQFLVERQTLDQRRAIQELQSSFEQASRSLRNTAGADAAAQQQKDLEKLGVQMSKLQAEISRMEAVTAQREAEFRAAESQLAAAQRNAEQGVLREVEILRGAVREGKTQIVP
jgi:Zn-dependent protease with chaperone function